MQDSRYKIPSLENFVNKLIGFIFYYRLFFVLAAFATTIIFATNVWRKSDIPDRLKNAALVMTGGSIIIGIFYSIINYEHNQLKFKHDVKTSRRVLSFNVALEWHKPAIVENLKITKQTYEQNKSLIEQNKSAEFFDILQADEKARAALISILNYFECIAIGVRQEIMDELFIKEFFKSLFRNYYNDYLFYIEYRRKKQGSPDMWKTFTGLAQQWIKQT